MRTGRSNMKKLLIGAAFAVLAVALLLATRRPKIEAPRAAVLAERAASSREEPPRAGMLARPTPPRRLLAASPRELDPEPLPDTVPSWAEAAITRRAFGDPDAVENYSYTLGMYAFLDRCAGPSIQAVDRIGYILEWTIDADGVAHDPRLELGDRSSPPDWTEAEVRTFTDCVEAYLEEHPTTFLPAAAARGHEHIYGTMTTQFPIASNPVYEFLRAERARAVEDGRE